MTETTEATKPVDSRYCRKRFDQAQTYILLPEYDNPKTRSKVIKPAHDFYNMFLQRLRYTESDKVPLGGVAFRPDTQVGTLYINPENCGKLPLIPLAGLLVHEILHVVKGHCYYIEARKDPMFWNLVSDAEVNQIVEELGYVLPSGDIVHDFWKERLQMDEDGFQPVTLEGLAEQFEVPCPPRGKTAIWYYRYFKDAIKERAKEKGETFKCPACGGTGQGSSSASGNQEQQGNSNDLNSDACNSSDGSDSSGPGRTEPDSGADDSEASSSGADDRSSGGELDVPGSDDSEPQPSGNTCPCCSGDGEVTIDELVRHLSEQTGHDVWKEINELPSDLRELTREFAAKLFDDVVRNNPDGLPGIHTADYQEAIKVLRKEIPWYEKLDSWWGGAGTLTSGWHPRRYNKKGLLGRARFEPGRRIGILLDVSGSVSNEEFGAALGVCVGLMEQDESEVYVLEVDTQVKAEYLLNDIGVKEEYNRHGVGGTILTPGFERLYELEHDEGVEFAGHLIITDGGLFEWPQEDLVHPNTLWVVTVKDFQLPKGVPGEVVYLDASVKPHRR